MSTPKSIRRRLARAFYPFFLLLLVLGAISFGTVWIENEASSEFRDRWLQSTRVIGDLENFTSDFRAAEGGLLLSRSKATLEATKADLSLLEQRIAFADHEFQSVAKDVTAERLFEEFRYHWQSYRESQERERAFFESGDLAHSVSLYQGESRESYNAASDSLEKLRNRNNTLSHQASIKVEKIQGNVLTLVAIAASAALVLALIAERFLGNSLFRPLAGLIDRMQALAQHHLEQPVIGTEREDEIGDMARSVDQFRGNILALAESRNALEKQAGILLEQYEAEQSLSLHQRNFVSMASHEFRTPLGVIDGQAQRLMRRKNALDAGEISERCEVIRKEVARLVALIEKFLNATHMLDPQSEIYLNMETFEIGPLLAEVIQHHRELFPYISIRESLNRATVWVRGDEQLLHQCFANVIGNAIKYSRAAESVSIRVETNPQFVSVTIIDRGIGIPDADLAHVGDRLFRASNTAGIVGTGLGLYMVKSVLRRHGGAMSVSSRLGVGTEVTLSLPRAEPR